MRGIGAALALLFAVGCSALPWLLSSREQASEAEVLRVPGSRTFASTARELPYVSTFEILATYPHSPSAFTQGLVFDGEGRLYESDGLFGKSGVREVEVRTGNSRKWTAQPHEAFGEGLQPLGNKLIQLTWKNNQVFEYRHDTLQHIRTVPVSIGRECWGLAADPAGTKLYITDSTDMLFHVEPETYRVLDKFKIVDPLLGPKAIHGVNELEWVHGELWGNIYPMYQGKHSECVVRIDPANGKVKGWVDMRGLLARQASHVTRAPMNYVLNGIAWHEPTDRLYVTGKMWNNMYQVHIKGADELSTPEHVHRHCQLG